MNMAKKFDASLWVKAYKRWSDKTWRDGQTGCFFYSSTSSLSRELDGANGTKLIFLPTDAQKEAQKETQAVLLQIPNGREGGAQLPDECYFGIDDSNAGQIMTVEDFESLVAKQVLPDSAKSPSQSKQATA